MKKLLRRAFNTLVGFIAMAAASALDCERIYIPAIILVISVGYLYREYLKWERKNGGRYY